MIKNLYLLDGSIAFDLKNSVNLLLMSSRTYVARSDGAKFDFAELIKNANIRYVKFTLLFAFIQFASAKPVEYVKGKFSPHLPLHNVISRMRSHYLMM